MQITEEERLEVHVTPEEPEKKPLNKPLIIAAGVVLVLAAVAAGYLFFKSSGPATPVAAPQPAKPAAVKEVPPTPQIPVRKAEETADPEFSLPPLNLSDADFRMRLINLSADMAPWLQTEELIRRGVSFTDGLTHGNLLTNLISIPAPSGKFLTERNGGRVYISKENFARYDYLVEIIDSIDPEALTRLFDLYRPLLEEAYGELGYKPESLGAKVIQSLDQILKVPAIETPTELKHETVYFTFADPELENMSPLQKQLVRMGPETTKVVQQKARAFRDNLLAQPTPEAKPQPEAKPEP